MISISRVITYKGAWEKVTSSYHSDLENALSAISEYTDIMIEMHSLKNSTLMNGRRVWNECFLARQWSCADSFHFQSQKRTILGALGPFNENISVGSPVFHSTVFSSWLFHQTTVAIRNKLIEIPLTFIPSSNLESITVRHPRGSFDRLQRQLENITPLSHPYPFAVIEYSATSDETIEVFHIDAEAQVDHTKVIDRCIEFPPEYHQAGLNILSFFGKYLREQYPEEDAKVKIEQDGLIVRLVIESKDGTAEVLEKALHEYQMIVSGQEPPETLIQNESLVVELKNELRMAKMRIEHQQDLNQLISNRNSKQSEEIDTLLSIIRAGLENKAVVSVDFKPSISLSNTTAINHNISYAIGGIAELLQALPENVNVKSILQKLEGGLSELEKTTDPEVVKKSAGMSQFRKFIENVQQGNNDIAKTIKAVESGIDIMKDLAGKYNSLAQWCGLPQVPTMFTK